MRKREIKTQGNYMAYRDGERVAGFALPNDLQLFKAAPALLAALDQLMEWEGYDHESSYYPDEDTEQRANDVWNDAKAAIAKAPEGLADG